MTKREKIVFYLPTDAIVHTLKRRLSKQGYHCAAIENFKELLRNIDSSANVIINYSKRDEPRYIAKVFLGTIYARLFSRAALLFMMLDPLDACDNKLFRPLLFIINFIIVHFADTVFIMPSRSHIKKRYLLSAAKTDWVENYPDPDLWKPEPIAARQPNKQEIRFFYHGELAWWHGLERLAPVLDELKKFIKPKLVVAGNLYPTSWHFFKVPLTFLEIKKRRELREFLTRRDVEHLARVGLDKLKDLMRQADFYVSQLSRDSRMADTELRTCLLEAMAFAMPCLQVKSAALARPEFIDQENIIFIDPEQAGQSSQKILSIFNDSQKMARIKTGAYQTVAKHFALLPWLQKFANNYLKREQKLGLVESVVDIASRPLGMPLFILMALISTPIAKLFPAPRQKLSNDKPVCPDANSSAAVEICHELPFISVIVPVFNAQRTVGACLDSLMKLDYPKEKCEIIIVDNGSTDSSAEIISHYDVQLLKEPRRGASSARNRGVLASQGSYLAFTDSDCIVARDWLHQFVTAVKSTSHDILGGEIKGVGIDPLMQKFVEQTGILRQEDAVNCKALDLPFVMTANCLVAKKVFDQIGLFNPQMVLAAGEDVEWCWRALFAGFKIGYIPQALVSHWHRFSAKGLYFQFYKYGLVEAEVFLKFADRFERKQLRRRLWINPWIYRRFFKTVALFPFHLLGNTEQARLDWLHLTRELGYLSGKVRGNLAHIRTFKYIV